MGSLKNGVKTVLVVEDKPEVLDRIKRIFKPYQDKLRLQVAETAKHALDILYPEKEARQVDAMIMDIMLSYGDKKTREVLHGEGDVSNLETGILLLQYIREQEKNLGQPVIWVNGITGRNAPHVLKEFDKLLEGKGRLLLKPFNDFLLENDIALVLGLDSKVPEILLPQGYVPLPLWRKTMDYEFEHLSRAFMDAMYKVRDKASLLELACALLKAKAAVLVDIFLKDDGKSQKQISERFPKDGSIPKIDPGTLWEWVEDAWHPEFGEGLIIEKGLQVGDCSFSGGLIAFGEKNLICPGRQQAMIVLQNGQATGQKPVFLSYHSWVASNLLKFYEFNLIQKKNQKIRAKATTDRAKAATEERQKNYYMQYASGKVLPNEKWEDLKDRIQEEKEEVRPIYHGIWILYQIFRLNNQNKGERESFAHVYKKDRGEAAGQGYWIEDLKQAIDDYTKEENPETGNFAQIIQWMMTSSRIAGFDGIEQLIKKAGFMDGIGDKGGIQPLQDQFVCHFFCYLWLDVMHQAATNQFRCRQTETEEGTKKGNPSIQSELFDQFSNREKLEIDPLITNVTRLMKLTNELLLGFLDSPLFHCNETELSDWGREALRLYLAIEITGNSSRMEQLYLDKEKTQEHRHAPEKLKRHFILNLARFMISVLMICLGRQNIHLEPEFRMISRPEELDSLLYILDRYVHVELGVDKRLNIREMLGRQIAAEVHLHLASPHYRDHLLHVIDVFLLGHLILNTHVHWIDREERPLVQHLSRINAKGKNEDHSLAMEKSWLRNWAAASLLHDIGYQLGHGCHTSKEPKVWKEYFSLTSKDSFKALQLDIETGSGEDSLKTCKAFLDELYGIIHNLKVPGRYLLPPLMKAILTDHGVLSALRVSQVLLHADNQYSIDDGKLTKELIEAYALAIHAISHHNLHPIRVCLNENPLAVLLRLCDELQEWDRRRVNVERVIKGLYLDIQENAGESLPGHDLLETFCANIRIEPSDDRCNGPLRLELGKRERDVKRPWFSFCLRYRDAVAAQFDPSLTLLEKSYCFQNIDLSLDSQKQNEIKVMVEMQFPVPKAYNEMLEYDIYGMFTEEARDFPLLGEELNMNQSPAGLVKLIDREDQNGITLESFGIILQQKSEARLGLLPVDPGQYRDRYISFKNKLLSHIVNS